MLLNTSHYIQANMDNAYGAYNVSNCYLHSIGDSAQRHSKGGRY
ncbi:532_t:CDS:1, partial [Gigaspora rosea]